jgi:hypothetical protein
MKLGRELMPTVRSNVVNCHVSQAPYGDGELWPRV